MAKKEEEMTTKNDKKINIEEKEENKFILYTNIYLMKQPQREIDKN